MSAGRGPLAGAGRDQLIESHLPLVRAVARRYAGHGADLEDLVQVGSIGLIKASDRFDPARGVAFATFATPRIEGEIRHHLRDRASALRIPRDVQRLRRDVRRAQRDLGAALGRTPSASEIAAAAGCDEAAAVEALRAGPETVPAMPSETEPEPEATGPEPFAGSDDRLLLAAGMRSLDERERRIVYLRFHADQTERQIAREMGLSQAHVSRLLARALATLKRDMASTEATAPPDITPARAVSRVSPQPTEKPSEGAMQERTERRDPGNRIERVTGTGKSKPAPPRSGHSGRFLVRMPSTLHADLARAAERRNVSLNRFVTDALAASLSRPETEEPPAPARTPGPGRDGARPADTSPRSGRSLRVALAANLVVVGLAAAAAIVLLVLALQRGI